MKHQQQCEKKLRDSVTPVKNLQGVPTYTKITNMVSTTMVFWLMYLQMGIFTLLGDLLQSH